MLQVIGEVRNSEEKMLSPNSSEFKLEDIEVMDFIANKVSDKYLYLISSKNSAKEMWKAILKSFEMNSKLKLSELQSQLFDMQFKGKGSLIEEHLRKFRQYGDTFQGLGDKLEKEDYMQQLLKSLLLEFLPLKVMVSESLDKMSWDKLQQRIVEFRNQLNPDKEKTSEERNGKSSITAFTTYFSGTCNICHKHGHKARNC